MTKRKTKTAPVLIKCPTTPEEVIDFIGGDFMVMHSHNLDGSELPRDAVTYTLSVHDLLSAFNKAADFK
jgi:hypothetical protein